MSKVCDCGFYDKRKRHRCSLGIQMGPVRKTVPYQRKEGAHADKSKYTRKNKYRTLDME